LAPAGEGLSFTYMTIYGYVFIHEAACQNVTAPKGTQVFAMMGGHPIGCNVTNAEGKYMLRIHGPPQWNGTSIDLWVMYINVTRVTLQYGRTLYLNLTVEQPSRVPFGFAFGQMVRWSTPKKAYFIYAEPKRMMREVAVYDRISGNLTHELCNSTQNILYDSNVNYIVQTGPEKGKLLLNNSVALFFGGPCPHICVAYYEKINATPVKFYWNKTDNTFNFILTKTGEVVASLPHINFTHEDMFVIEVFRDSNNNLIFIFYGFDWKGTWAAGIYMHLFLSTHLSKLDSNFYIYHWIDLNMDGEPQTPEINQEYP